MSFELFIARRYLKSRKRPQLFSINTFISVGGIVLGVAALILVLAIFNGISYEIQTRIIGLEGHVNLRVSDSYKGISNYREYVEDIRRLPHVLGCTPYVEEIALLTSNNDTRGLKVKGIAASSENLIMTLREHLLGGEVNLDTVKNENGRLLPGILIGFELARDQGVKIGDTIYLVSPAGLSVESLFLSELTGKLFRITGVFRTRLVEIDESMVFCDLKAAQTLFQYGDEISGIEIRLDQMDRSNALAARLNSIYKTPLVAETWFERNKALFTWMSLEKWLAFIVLSLIIIVAGFNIISTLVMVVMEKTPEIGILKSMGADEKLIRRIFLIQGAIMGSVGTIIGVLVGLVGCWLQETFKLFSLPSGNFLMDALPVRLQLFDTLVIAVVAIFLSISASYYPAKKAAELDPVESIRFHN